MTINELLADSEGQFSLDIFSAKSIASVNAALIEKNGKYYLKCCAPAKEVIAKPEEIIRQLWLRRLEHDYKYPVARLAVEYPITFGRASPSVSVRQHVSSRKKEGCCFEMRTPNTALANRFTYKTDAGSAH
jgi:hypothetical protein